MKKTTEAQTIAQYRKEMRLYAVGSFMYNWYKDAIMNLRINLKYAKDG